MTSTSVPARGARSSLSRSLRSLLGQRGVPGQLQRLPTAVRRLGRGVLGGLLVLLSAVCLSCRPDPEEVADVLEVPLRLLLDPATRREEDWVWRGVPLHVPFYAVGEHKIWGATAIVLTEFLALLAQEPA